MARPDAVNILIVDDVPEKLLALSALLEGPGVHIITASNGREALRKLLTHEFAVILLDVQMPDMDGFETAALIRQRKQTAGTPIIFVTGYGDEMHQAQGYSLGAVDFIQTPVLPDVLKTKVGVFVELFRMREQIKRQAEERVTLAREQALRAAAEEATRRSEFLAAASTALTASLDLDETVRGLLRVVVPQLADLAAVTLAGEPGQPWRSVLGWAGANGIVQTTVSDARTGPFDELREIQDRVLATGEPELVEGLDVANPFSSLPDNAGQLYRALVLPLLARGRTLGALTLAQWTSCRGIGPPDRAVAEDLVDRAAIALDNARLYRDIRDADRRKDEFLAMLSHELRNPLAPIRSSVEILRRLGGEAPDMRWARDVITRQLHHMTRLIDDLLDVSRITRGTIKLQPVPTDLSAVVARAIETVRPMIEAREHHVSICLPEGAMPVIGDPTRLEQVAANLLNNAAKYTPTGGRIDISLRTEKGEAVLSCKDTGVGIPEEMLEQIFQPFTQVNRTLDRSEGGLGIGLTLVKRLVEMQGGSVCALSDGPGKGSEFIVRMRLADRGVWVDEKRPVHQATENGTADEQAPASKSRTYRRILVVDDNVDGAQSLAMLLRTVGHEVQVYHDGLKALESARTFRPDVVLLDIGLPGLNGFEVAERLRGQSGGGELLLVAITGYGQASDVRRAQEAGFDHHFIKPIDPDVLQDLLSRPTRSAECAMHSTPTRSASEG
jgi:signal transduction histidine kinase/DNA-binding response OmpR family regulator